jgi:hypothetical protein
MTADADVDCVLHDCLFALGQGVGSETPIDLAAVAWLRARYRATFVHVMTRNGNSWARDRDRVMAVSRYMGQCARHLAAAKGRIDVDCIREAAATIEAGCQMNADREANLAPVARV